MFLLRAYEWYGIFPAPPNLLYKSFLGCFWIFYVRIQFRGVVEFSVCVCDEWEPCVEASFWDHYYVTHSVPTFQQRGLLPITFNSAIILCIFIRNVLLRTTSEIFYFHSLSRWSLSTRVRNIQNCRCPLFLFCSFIIHRFLFFIVRLSFSFLFISRF